MTLTSFLRKTARILDEAGVPYMLTGSLAAAYYATPRATQDVDVVIDTSEAEVGRLVDLLLAEGLYVDRGTALTAWRTRSQFNAIDPDTGWKIDLIIRKDRAFSRAEFARRERAEMFGIEVALATLEDVVLAKLEWASMGDPELQRGDVLRLLQNEPNRLDRSYIERWAESLGIMQEWRSMLDRLDEDQRDA
ncbi:hypothetical protein [Gaopeijia maritima]|uniref:Nucleotidyltransferase family protein n=1 Tax=Gaopeijia maritima TaxID=3119007 RepID=A0ABU9EAW8_9BACT